MRHDSFVTVAYTVSVRRSRPNLRLVSPPGCAVLIVAMAPLRAPRSSVSARSSRAPENCVPNRNDSWGEENVASATLLPLARRGITAVVVMFWTKSIESAHSLDESDDEPSSRNATSRTQSQVAHSSVVLVEMVVDVLVAVTEVAVDTVNVVDVADNVVDVLKVGVVVTVVVPDVVTDVVCVVVHSVRQVCGVSSKNEVRTPRRLASLVMEQELTACLEHWSKSPITSSTVVLVAMGQTVGAAVVTASTVAAVADSIG
jgi:hypothetical protein